MNIELLAADIASRVPSMAQDSTVNNVETIKGLIEQEIKRTQRVVHLRYKYPTNLLVVLKDLFIRK
jgi:hypothetical protein